MTHLIHWSFKQVLSMCVNVWTDIYIYTVCYVWRQQNIRLIMYTTFLCFPRLQWKWLARSLKVFEMCPELYEHLYHLIVHGKCPEISFHERDGRGKKSIKRKIRINAPELSPEHASLKFVRSLSHAVLFGVKNLKFYDSSTDLRWQLKTK